MAQDRAGDGRQLDRGAPTGATPSADDTEGHALPIAMGLGALRRNRERDHGRRLADEELPPLTKSFPPLRGDRPR